MTKMTDAEMRKITRLAVADLERRTKDDAAKHKARPENRSVRLRQAEAEVKSSAKRDPREVYYDMDTDTKPARGKAAAKKASKQKPRMNRAALLSK
ncbi:hypothetical protein [Bradyrhizobium sp. AS23.2]|uniref:hypothetical protein n=1 Tax=Bradyrhizobium sp. AS23.2 TaxID=1680155 RepID=UPI00093992E1|nr:hypothetical protein [Bradyrhizobium sp. AS23.2]OKO78560.1 hypothetical protein AC630_18945 [Bradyrhizobium sp. AS23.2]